MTVMTSRILVVDDERMVRWSLRQALERAGYQVDEASTAAEALEHAAREAPDVVLLDYRLPDRTGVEVLNAQRELYRTKRDLSQARYAWLLSRLRLKLAAGTLSEADLSEINALLSGV